jgi:cytochrome c peroxidase
MGERMKQMTCRIAGLFLLGSLLGGCGGGGSDAVTLVEVTPAAVGTATALTAQTAVLPVTAVLVTTAPPAVVLPATELAAIDLALIALIDQNAMSANPASNRDLPLITEPVAQLGKALFYSKQLSGEQDVACVSCHHPSLGGADGLSLSVGVHAVDASNLVDAALLGPGRHSELAGSLPVVPRNAPSVFNAGLWDEGMFWDSRVTSHGGEADRNGQASGIISPDGPLNNEGVRGVDASIAVGTSLAAAQARFPVSSVAEMRGNAAVDSTDEAWRELLATRLEDPQSGWLALFSAAFGSVTIDFDIVATAIGEYERSMNFVASPWQAYVEGDIEALSDSQKRGATAFLMPVDQGGAGCSRCHQGSTFSDSQHHIVGFPQLSDDTGRQAVSGDEGDRYHFRTPSLLNVAVTAPYGHAGLYQSLEDVVNHYDNPDSAVDRLFGVDGGVAFADPSPPFCALPQISRSVEASGRSCVSLYPEAYGHSLTLLRRLNGNAANSDLGPRPNLNSNDVADLVAFMEALTDPCVLSRACLDPWILDRDDIGAYPDDSLLIGRDEGKLDL